MPRAPRRPAPAPVRHRARPARHADGRDAEGQGQARPEKVDRQIGRRIRRAGSRASASPRPARSGCGPACASVPVPLSRYSQTNCGMRRSGAGVADRKGRDSGCAESMRGIFAVRGKCPVRTELCQAFRRTARRPRDDRCRPSDERTFCEQFFISAAVALDWHHEQFRRNWTRSNGASLSARAMAARPAALSGRAEPRAARGGRGAGRPGADAGGRGHRQDRALTARIAHLLSTGTARPNEILAVTFTNKAAREMKNRVGAMLGQRSRGCRGWAPSTRSASSCCAAMPNWWG